MDTYAILRRSGWRSGAELEEAAARSTRVGNEDMPDEVRWIRSYVLGEGDGSVGTVCIYQATDEAALRRHADLAELPIDDQNGPYPVVVFIHGTASWRTQSLTQMTSRARPSGSGAATTSPTSRCTVASSLYTGTTIDTSGGIAADAEKHADHDGGAGP